MAFGYFGIVGWALALQIWRPGARRDKRELALVVPLVGGLAVGTGTWPVFDVLLSIPFVKLVSDGIIKAGKDLGQSVFFCDSKIDTAAALDCANQMKVQAVEGVLNFQVDQKSSPVSM